MKKEHQNKKKLSLKKIQLTKLNNMNAIHGGNYFGNTDLTNHYITGCEEPPTPIRNTVKP